MGLGVPYAASTVVFLLALATGDLNAHSLNFGYLESGAVFAAIIAVPALAYWRRLLPEVPAFWFAYILTRPLGASFADWSAVAPARGRLGWGTGPVSLGLAVLIVVLVSCATVLARRAAARGRRRSESPLGLR